MTALQHECSCAETPVGVEPHTWKPLHLLNLYRLTLSSLFLVLSAAVHRPPGLDEANPLLFQAVSAAYLVFSIATSFIIRWRLFGFQAQVYFQVLVDILAITLLMHASGGVTSGVGTLLIVAIAAGSLLMAGRMAGFFAAIAALAVLGQQLYAHPLGSTASYVQAGVLGAAFFATALLARVLAARVRASEALAAQHATDLANMARLNETIIQRMQSGVLVIDKNNRIHLMNESARFLLGTPTSFEGKPLETLSPELAEQLQAWRAASLSEPYVFRCPAGSADVLPRFTQLDPAGMEALIFLDNAAAIAQQVQQAKLASLGRLTASIAHEVRNPLGAISHAGQLLAESPSLNDGDRRLTEIICEQSRRVNTIIENVLQLSRRRRSRPETFSLEPWLENFIAEFCQTENVSPEQIAIDVPPAGLQVRIDPSHLHQVLWNLCQNGLWHGASEQAPARLLLRGGISRELRGPYLEVIDSGPGIPPEVAQQIFEPFFTTRAQGTGLGLYVARELCEHNRAHLIYLPVPTGGSCFRISFASPEMRVLKA